MKNKLFKKLWFQSKIYKPEYFNKLVYIWVKEVDIKDIDIDTSKVEFKYNGVWTDENGNNILGKTIIQYLKVTKVLANNWNGETLDNDCNANIIEAIDKNGSIIFIYNATTRILIANNTTYENVPVERIIELLKDSAFNFYTGKKRKEYKLKQEKIQFLRNKCLEWKGGLFYIIKKKQQQYELPHGHNDGIIYDYADVYTVYDGKFLGEIYIDRYSQKISRTVEVNIPRIDEQLKKYNIKLKPEDFNTEEC